MLNRNNGETGHAHSLDAAGAAAAPAPKTSLLIIEDDDNISTAIGEYFSRAGYAVSTAPDGLAGIEAAVKSRPDVVVLDLMLPKMDGLAVCKELRQKHPQMPILMLTAKDDVVDKVLGLEMGADDYITKPFSLREIPDAFFRANICSRRSGTTLMKDMTGRLILTLIACEQRSKKILITPNWCSPSGASDINSPTQNRTCPRLLTGPNTDRKFRSPAENT